MPNPAAHGSRAFGSASAGMKACSASNSHRKHGAGSLLERRSLWQRRACLQLLPHSRETVVQGGRALTQKASAPDLGTSPPFVFADFAWRRRARAKTERLQRRQHRQRRQQHLRRQLQKRLLRQQRLGPRPRDQRLRSLLQLDWNPPEGL